MINHYSALLLLLGCVAYYFVTNKLYFTKNPIFSTKWEGNSGKHLLVMKKEINQNNTAEYLSVKQVTKGKDDCISNDYIIDCEMDINLNGGKRIS
ncbi:hypothetical protein [Klebsiella pneumoniae]|uniref:hypothetical protein n=1 Tax=Klebsiella pneumoniae TaxID=573 RepID=UPI000F5443A2|nr:hypothetical protein [Klebsiella pneumoniae]